MAVSTILFAVFIGISSFAQTTYHITTSQGLATNQLTVLIKDHQNKMWFGSYNGLHKHEGTFIKVYNKSGKDSASLSSKEMHAAFEDRLGFIWAGTTGGLDKLDPKTGFISHYKLKFEYGTDDRIGYIISIFQDDLDNIWVVTEVGMFIVDYKTGNYKMVPGIEVPGEGIPEFGLLYKGSIKTKEGIWMFAQGYVIFYDFKTHRFLHQFNNPGNKPIFNLRLKNNFDSKSELCIDKADNLYFIFNNNSLIKYNVTTEKLDSFHFEFPRNAWQCCYALSTDHKGNVWIGFRFGGLLFFNAITHTFTKIQYEDANSLVQSNYVYSLCQDYLNRMWVNTNNGIFIIDYYNSSVKQQYLSDNKDFINLNYVAGLISKDDMGNIYIPYNAGGLFKHNIYTGNNIYYAPDEKMPAGYTYVYTGEPGRLYFGSRNAIMHADTTYGRVVLTPAKDLMAKLLKDIPTKIVWIYKYNRNAVYIKKSNGNIYYFNGTNTLETIVSTGFSKQACLSRDKQYLLFQSGNNDIIKRNLATLRMDTILLYQKLKEANFSYTLTLDMADDGNGNIWVTSQNGLIRYSEKTGNVNTYTTTNGLLHDFSFTLCADSKKRLWVGNMGGVNLYDAVNDRFINVFPELPDKLSNYFGSSLEAADGHIYFQISGKLININPEKFLSQNIKDRILELDEVQVDGIPVDEGTGELMHLTYQQNRLYFRFGLLQFDEPNKVQYTYRLQGYDTGWSDLGNHSEVTFNALPHGSYTLHVKATDVYGRTVKKAIAIPFLIRPPFWATGWFRVVFLLCIIGGLYAIVKWREKNIRSIEAGKTRLQKLTAEKYKSQLEAEQINSFFTTSLFNKNDTDDVLWEVAKNLIGKLGFVDCMIYLWNEDKTALVQKAGYGPKGSLEALQSQRFTVVPGQGVVGTVAQSGEALIIPDTTVDSRYLVDDAVRLSEICVPIKYNEELLGVLDSEHTEKNFFTTQHLQALTTIATLVASKIKSIESDQRLRHQNAALADINQQLAEVQLAALRSQMNPHFIFNALNAIKKFVIANEPANAEKYLGKFSRLIRSILDNSQKRLVTIEKEVALLTLYLELEKLRFGDKLSFQIEIDGDIAAEDEYLPSMIVQPFVENAILHGIMHRESGGNVTVSFHRKKMWMEIVITDNGIGRSKSKEYKSPNEGGHHSIGIEVTTKRLLALKKQDHVPAGVDIIDLTDDTGEGCGTKVIISVPNL